MRIAEVSVHRPVFAIMMTAALIVLGAVSYESLGLDLMPKTDAAVVSVQANLPGASAEEIETQVTKRIEEAVNTISGIDELRASSDQGNSRVTITFTLERDIESVVAPCRDCGVLSKVIIEAALLTDDEKVAACTLAKAAAADYVKTSTGFGPGGATPGKPVGTVCFAWADSDTVASLRLQLTGDRAAVREASVQVALEGLLSRLI